MNRITRILLIIVKGYLVLAGLFLVSMWGFWCIMPKNAMEYFQVTANNVTGLNMLKSDMGGAVLINGLFIFLYFTKGRQWLYPAIVATAALLGTRILSMIIDGSSPDIVIAIVVEVLGLSSLYCILMLDNPLVKHWQRDEKI